MKSQLFEELAKSNPDLFYKSAVDHFTIPDGWYNIVSVLCNLLSYNVERARDSLKFATENQSQQNILHAEKHLENEIAALPIIKQVKEKFGSLRFYVDNSTEQMDNYIEFALCMSRKTCEVCGAPGEIRQDTWLQTICDKHRPEETPTYEEKLSNGVKLDEEPDDNF